MMKLLVGLLTVAGIVAVKGIAWYCSPETRAKRERKRRRPGHRANADKNSEALGAWFRDRWKR